MSQTAPAAPPLISVIIPVYNGAAFLREAVTCVQRQNYEPLEIIVADDGSTDATPAVARELGAAVRYQRQEQNQRAGAARNRGLEMARGPVIAFLDVDDLWPDGKLQAQMALLQRHPEFEIVLGKTRYAHLPGALHGVFPGEDDPEGVAGPFLSAGLYRRSVFDLIGPFDETLPNNEDMDWFLRARELGVPMYGMSRVTHIYRLHANNWTRSWRPATSALPLVFKRSLERRRRSGAPDIHVRPWSDYYYPLDEAGAAPE